MAERAHPDIPGFKDRFFGLVKSKYKANLFNRYKFCNKYIKGKKVLDIPCGVGWGTSLLKGHTQIIGVDIDDESIKYANDKYGRGNTSFVVGSMSKIPFDDNSFEVVVCLEGIEHVDKDTGVEFVKESQRVLNRGGLLIITCPVLNNKGESTMNPYHLYEYPEQELVDLVNKHFRIHLLQRFSGPEGPEYKIVAENLKGKRYG